MKEAWRRFKAFLTGKPGFYAGTPDPWQWRLGIVPEVNLAPGFHFDHLSLTVYLGPLLMVASYTDRD